MSLISECFILLAYIWGLAGADLESDFILLNSEFKGYFKGTYFKIVSDSWIAFSTMSEKEWGAVSICGTGKNIVIKDVDGKTYRISALNIFLVVMIEEIT